MIPEQMQREIRIIMMDRGIKQIDIAKKFHLGPGYVNYVIHGVKPPNQVLKEYFAELLGISTDELVGKKSDPEAA